MDTNGKPNPENTRAQSSIRSFFQPKQPNYTAPPSAPLLSKREILLPSSSSSQSPPELSPKPLNSASPLPDQARISIVHQEHIQPLRRINALLLPVSYPDSFYHKTLSPDAPISFSRVILWTEPSSSQAIVVGGIVCRLDPALAPDSTPQSPQYISGSYDIYIQSLALLSPYRGMGLMAQVLKEVIESATSQQETSISSLYAHVWTESEEALNWYNARGFKKEDPFLHGYYRRLKPDTAWIVRRRLSPSDHLTALSLAPGIAPATNVLSPNLPSSRPEIRTSARSFQERGPDREWNDLPEDVLNGTLRKQPPNSGPIDSVVNSRSSSKSGIEGKGRKKRVYPAAAFGT